MRFNFSMAFSDPTHCAPMAQCADECGFHAIALSDHVVHPARIDTPYPYTEDGKPRWEPDAPWPEPWVAIGAMAAVTTRLHFYTSVYVLPMRTPFAVAKAVGTAAILSGNRVTLGIGMGWMEEEFALLEQPFARRGKRADEMVEVLRTLWRGGMVEHHGEFYDFDPLQMSPAPTEPVPILVGGFSDFALRRAARLADGWISDLHTTDELEQLIGKLRGKLREEGRDASSYKIVATVSDAWNLDGYRRLEDMGVAELCTMPWAFYGGTTDDLQAKCDGMRKFADDILSKM